MGKKGARKGSVPVSLRSPPRLSSIWLDRGKFSDYGQRMQEAMIAEVRRFNRTITAHIGALTDRFMGRSLPLGEARLLWEIGPEGSELRSLRSRLELDSGYVSRLLRSLEAA